MDTKEMKEGPSECGHCGGCGHGMCGRGHWGHILIKVLVAVFIFWCGVQFGELRGLLHGGNYTGGYGYGMMSGWTQ